MKRVLLYIGIVLAAIGCTKIEITEEISTGGEISFSAGVTTRVSSSDDCTWKVDDEDPDEVGIFTNLMQEDGTEANLKFTINDTNGSMTNDSEQELYTLASGERTYYAYHPYIAPDNLRGDLTLSETTISIDHTQTEPITPLLWASTISNEKRVEFYFAHKFVKVTFNITANGVDVTSFEDIATLKGANAKTSFSIESGKFSSQTTGDITLEIEDGKVVVYLIPMSEVSDNVELWLTAEGNAFIYPITTSTWESGSEYAYNITLGKVDI